MKTFTYPILALALTLSFSISSCSNQADVVPPEQNPAELVNHAIDPLAEQPVDLNNAGHLRSLKITSKMKGSNPNPESYVLEVKDGKNDSQLILTGLAANDAWEVTAHKQDNGTFTFAQTLQRCPDSKGKVQISGAGEFSGKWVRIYLQCSI